MSDQPNRSINQQIAELLGWTDIQLDEDWPDCDITGDYTRSAWVGVPPGGHKSIVREILDFEHSLDAIKEILYQRPGDTLSVWRLAGGDCAEILAHPFNPQLGYRTFTVMEEEFAAAKATLKYLQWKKSQEG